jgi:hypothetical protein
MHHLLSVLRQWVLLVAAKPGRSQNFILSFGEAEYLRRCVNGYFIEGEHFGIFDDCFNQVWGGDNIELSGQNLQTEDRVRCS